MSVSSGVVIGVSLRALEYLAAAGAARAGTGGPGGTPDQAGSPNAWWFWLLLPVTLAAVAGAVAWIVRRDSEQWRLQHGLCPYCGSDPQAGRGGCPACTGQYLCEVCGYDLRATPGRCPECGSVPTEDARRSASRIHWHGDPRAHPSVAGRLPAETAFSYGGVTMGQPSTPLRPATRGQPGPANAPGSTLTGDNGTHTDDPNAPPDLTAVPFLERRLGAAVWDLSILSLCFIGIVWAFGPHAQGARSAPALQARHPWVGGAAAAALVLFAAAELLTGVTPGKWLLGLSVRRKDGTRPPVWTLIVRGLVRLGPVALLVLGQLTPDPLTSLWICGVTLVGVGCYVPACYILLMKTGRSMFDAAAGTIVVRSRPDRPQGGGAG